MIYPWVCRCGEEGEVSCSPEERQKVLKAVKCPSCGKKKVRRRYDPPIIHFQGSGWGCDNRKEDEVRTRRAQALAEGRTTPR